MRSRWDTVRRAIGAAAAGLLVAGLVVGTATSAVADTAPPDPALPPTVSADALPTVQVNGVVWDQVIVGSRVYVTGNFSQARPPGSPAGSNQTPRANLLAYDLATGALVTSWAPSLNGQGLTIAASGDGTRIYVGGDFTQVNGTTRNRIAALDASTGALVGTFATGGANSRVRAITVTASTVHIGGGFTQAGGQARSRLAAFSAATGALLPWAPAVDAEVFAMTAPPGTTKLVVAGRFTTLNGAAWYGMGAVDATSGATLPWAATSIVRDAGPDASLYDLTSDATQVYGVGYVFGPGGNVEGSFAASSSDGTVRWIVGCLGDTYGIAVLGPVSYTVGHAHNCSQIGAFPQENPWTYQRAMATTTTPAADGRTNIGGPHNGRPAPEMLHWLPTLATGSFTGQYQAAWTVTGNGQYVVVGGEFPNVNGVGQQGLARFAVRGSAPNQQGPQGQATLTPALQATAGAGVRASWTAAWDRDNRRLTYELLRGATTATSAVVARVEADTEWWSRRSTALVDAAAPPGTSQTYRVRVRDPLGNTVVGSAATVAVPAGAAPGSAYRDAVRADGAVNLWRLGEASGTSAVSLQSADDLVLSGATRNQAGAIGGDQDRATAFAGGGTGVPGTTQIVRTAPQMFSVEAWVRTTSVRGGGIIGFGNSSTGASTASDRHLYMTSTGRVVFGVNPGAVRTVASPNAYNNGAWHHLVGTLGPDGMRLHVDGQLVAQRADTTRAQSTNGVWRVGGDTLTGWPDAPADRNLAGTIDEVATYVSPLPAARALAHWQLASGQVPNQSPSASFTATTSALTATVNGSASSDPDGTVAAHAWNFGDGQTGTGATTTHTYGAAGTYTVTLTVTDDDGATGSTTRSVTVAPPGQPGLVAADAFTRTVTGGLGSADTGGAWTVAGGAADTGVDGATARIRLPSPSAQRSAYLGVAESSTDVSASVSLDRAGTGGGAYVSVLGRRVGNDDYRVKLRFQSTGVVTAQLVRVVGGTETAIGTAVAVPGAAYVPGQVLRVRLQVSGTGTTSLSARVWRSDAAEPSTWLLTGSDTAASLQTAGGVGVVAYVSGSATNTPITVGLDDLAVTRTG